LIAELFDTIFRFSGTFTCVGDTVLTTCTVSFKVDQAFVQLPLKFSFQINLLNNHVYGMYLNIVGTKFLGKEYGYSTPVRADSGKVLFGYKASTVFNIDLQPYTFTGQADLEGAPQHAAGYFVLPNSVTRGSQEVCRGDFCQLPNHFEFDFISLCLSLSRRVFLRGLMLTPSKTALVHMLPSTSRAPTLSMPII
jgi:hypothetical protein